MRICQPETTRPRSTALMTKSDHGSALSYPRAREVLRVARLQSRRRVAVVAVDDENAAFAQECAALGLDLDAETRERLAVRQHVRLAGERGSSPGGAQVVAERPFRRRTAARGSRSRRASSRSARCSTTCAPARRHRPARTRCRSATRVPRGGRCSAFRPCRRSTRRKSRRSWSHITNSTLRTAVMGKGIADSSRRGSTFAAARDSAIMPPLPARGNASASPSKPRWRNWYTQQTQNLPVARP